MPVWQSALLAHGCHVEAGGQLLPIELLPVGDQIVCTPTTSGAMLPFDVAVTVGEPVIITWDHELSRYLVQAEGRLMAA